MKTLLCDFCLRSGMLCAKCQELVNSGAITEQYMEVGKFLLGIDKEYPLLQDVTLHNVVQEGNTLALVVGRGQREKFQSYGSRIIRAISEKFGKRSRILVLEKGISNRRFIEDLFSGMTIVTINTIWLPDGTTETKVVLEARRAQRPSLKRVKSLAQIAKRVTGISLRVEFA